MLRKGLAMVLDSLGAFLESGLEAIQSRFQDESRRLFQLILCAGALVVVGTIGGFSGPAARTRSCMEELGKE
jgi:hypothetical protein